LIVYYYLFRFQLMNYREGAKEIIKMKTCIRDIFTKQGIDIV